MHLRVRAAVAASSVLLLSACGSDTTDNAAPAPTPESVPTQAAAEVLSWTPVAYEDYLDAADEIGIRPDLRHPQAGFQSSLAALCEASEHDLAEMRQTHQSNIADTETYSAAQYLNDEVALRLGLACPHRMTDWAATRAPQDAGADHTDTDVADTTVSDEDLARATAEEAEGWQDEGWDDLPADASPLESATHESAGAASADHPDADQSTTAEPSTDAHTADEPSADADTAEPSTDADADEPSADADEPSADDAAEPSGASGWAW